MAETKKYLNYEGTTELVGKLKDMVGEKQDTLKAYSETESDSNAYNGVTAKLGGTEISFVNLLGTTGNLEIGVCKVNCVRPCS